jgi:hypothetical protein
MYSSYPEGSFLAGAAVVPSEGVGAPFPSSVPRPFGPGGEHPAPTTRRSSGIRKAHVPAANYWTSRQYFKVFVVAGLGILRDRTEDPVVPK